MPLGIFPQTSYQVLQANLSNASAIVIYKDGLTDALNDQEEPFGEERLLRFCQSLPEGASGKAIGSLILEKVSEWAADVEQFDDTTILVLALD